MKKLRYIVALIGSSLLVLSGCSTSNTQKGDNQSFVIHNPLDSIEPSEHPDPQAYQKITEFFTSSLSVLRAKEKVIQDCMASKGFPEYISVQENLYSLRAEILVTPLSVEQARVHGYDIPAGDNYRRMAESQNSLSPEAYEALYGRDSEPRIAGYPNGPTHSSDGCIVQGISKIYGSDVDAVFMETIPLRATTAYMNSFALSDGFYGMLKRWSACMKKSTGKDIDYPEKAQREYFSDHDIALADAQCRERVDYEGYILKESTPYLTKFLEENQSMIAKITELKIVGENNAKEILKD